MNKLHFQGDLLNGWEEDGEPMGELIKTTTYQPHVLEIPEPKLNSEKTIFLDPTKYKFNTQTDKKISIMTKFFYWLLVR